MSCEAKQQSQASPPLPRWDGTALPGRGVEKAGQVGEVGMPWQETLALGNGLRPCFHAFPTQSRCLLLVDDLSLPPFLPGSSFVQVSGPSFEPGYSAPSLPPPIACSLFKGEIFLVLWCLPLP